MTNASSRNRAIESQRLIVVPVEFPDMRHYATIESIRETVFKELESYYLEVSYGLMSISGNVTDKWYQIQMPLNTLNLEQWNYDVKDMNLFEQEAVRAVDRDVNLGEYDFVVLVASGQVWPHAKCSLPGNLNDGSRALKGIVVNEFSSMETYAHELGHVLPTGYRPRNGCGLPDLYSYQASQKGQESDIFVGPWDIMSASNSPKHFSAWSKVLLGWLTPEIVQLDATSLLPVTLQPLELKSGVRVILVPFSDTKYYVIEMRRRVGYDRYLPSEGVLVYLVDTSLKDGYGPIRVVNSHPSTMTLDHAPFSLGASFEDVKDQVYIAIVYADGLGLLTLISKSRMYPTQGLGQGYSVADFVVVDVRIAVSAQPLE